MQPPPSTSPADTLVDLRNVPRLSFLRRYTLLLLFCLAQFIDAFNNSALFSAIPVIREDIGINAAEAVWLISAFSLTFASFLLLSGKISDVYDPKWQFSVGVAGLGIFSLGGGFTSTPITLIILRGLTGCMGAMTIPSALSLIVTVFPDRQEQARAIGAFGACGATGNIIGLLIGALFVQYASWRWCFWFITVSTIPIAALCVLLIPSNLRADDNKMSTKEKIQSLDLIGVTILTVALVLLIFATTSGTTAGWSSAEVLAPLIISLFLIGAFLYYETTIPAKNAAVPPRTWFYLNFSVLFFVSILPYFWWSTVFNLFISLWQTTFHWSAVQTAIRTFPIGVVAFAMSFTGSLAKRIEPKWLILGAQVLIVIATVLFQYADTPASYWPYVFPAFAIGSGGAMLCYTHTNIAIFRTTPSSMAGTVGAIFNGGLQLGSAIGYAACGSVQASIDDHEARKGGTDGFAGRRAAFRVLLGLVCVQFVAVAIFMRTGHGADKDEKENEVDASASARESAEKTSTEKQPGDAPDVVLPQVSEVGDRV